MKEYCENPLCEASAFIEVAVSVTKPSDQMRTLCATCKESYMWGEQHGMMASEPENVAAFLREGGFVVLGMNRTDASQGAGFEAWAYQGPLDFNVAEPERFGLGETCLDALRTLDRILRERKFSHEPHEQDERRKQDDQGTDD